MTKKMPPTKGGKAKTSANSTGNDHELPWWKTFMRDDIAEFARLSPQAICARHLLRQHARLQSPLPADDAVLASMARLSVNEFAVVKNDALRGYELDDAGWWNWTIEAQRQSCAGIEKWRDEYAAAEAMERRDV